MNQGRCPGRAIWTSQSPTVRSPTVRFRLEKRHATCFLLTPDKKSRLHFTHLDHPVALADNRSMVSARRVGIFYVLHGSADYCWNCSPTGLNEFVVSA
ncbi:hypothetical protein LDENG_00160330 [Lucifuga dentata]|nr:hypothetical protein LDENG_00160330 [Lucifuga dentata]